MSKLNTKIISSGNATLLRSQGSPPGFFKKKILFSKVLFELSDTFYRLTKFKVTFGIEAIRVGELNRLLIEGPNKKKKRLFHKNIYSPIFFY